MKYYGYILTALVFTLNSCVSTTSDSTSEDVTPYYRQIDDYTLDAQRHLVKDIPARNDAKTVNVVIEIPTGTLQKWEVNKESGDLQWEIKAGVPRVVDYIGYPGNYGFVPQTILSKENGGDGDPLDVLVLGASVDRGAILQVEIIGMIKLLDEGEQDDKLIAVMANTPFSNIQSIEELEKKYAGVVDILKTWLANYKGEGHIEILGTGDKAEAQTVLETAIKAFEKE
jgi:inorganic pyrophosphatase